MDWLIITKWKEGVELWKNLVAIKKGDDVKEKNGRTKALKYSQWLLCSNMRENYKTKVKSVENKINQFSSENEQINILDIQLAAGFGNIVAMVRYEEDVNL